MEQPKLLKLLKMLLLLAGSRRYSLSEIEDRLEINERTAYRYLKTIEQAGLFIERQHGTYRLVTDDHNGRAIGELLHFSEEEACILLQTLSLLEGSTPMRERLVRKLHALYDLHALAQLKEKSLEEVVSRLGEAMRLQKQVVLLDYRSNNSESISDRTVEPFEFLSDYSAVWCYELESRSCKQFKIARIETVSIVDKLWNFANQHRLPFVDAFRMSSARSVATVRATLTLKAYNLLLEEYPLASQYIQPSGNLYSLEIPVADFSGIARFVLGLPGEVHVTAPPQFIEFLKNKRKQNCY